MNNDVVIRVKGLSKTFKLYKNPRHRLLEAVHPFRKKFSKDFHALQDISFEIRKGESVGILGKNGAGKSTLLKVLTGVLAPQSGTVEVKGRIAALLELGAGFNPSLTGYENIFFQGAIMGLSKKEMESKLKEIIEFAEIGQFIYQPVKSYSSGMFARLAFSIAINVDPDILIIDEALSVGDAVFQAKCNLKLRNMINTKGVTVLFVSHSTFAVRNLCKKALLLDGGKLVGEGLAGNVVEQYFALNVQAVQPSAKTELIKEEDSTNSLSNTIYGRIGNGKAKFLSVQLLNENRFPIQEIVFNQKVNLEFKIKINEDTDCLGYGFHIRNQDGVEVLYFATGAEVNFLRDVKANTQLLIKNEFELPLIQGAYTIAVVLSKPIDIEGGVADFLDFIPIAYTFEMQKKQPVQIYGLVGLSNKSTVQEIST